MRTVEMAIFVGTAYPGIDRAAYEHSDAKHLDIIAIQDPGYDWGREARERFLILTIQDLPDDMWLKCISADYRILTADKSKIGSEFLPLDCERFRSFSFDVDLLSPSQKQTILDLKPIGLDSNMLFTRNLSHNITLTPAGIIAKKGVMDVLIEKPVLDSSGLASGYEYIKGFELRQLAGEI